MIHPNSLYPGAKVALVAPASALSDTCFEPAMKLVRDLGLEPVVYPSCLLDNRHGYFAADDAQRAKDIQDAFADDSIDGVWCARGGYGCHRILPLLDLDAIARRPKYFAGYSDITALHTAFNQNCGFATYHTTMPTTEYENLNEYTMKYLRRSLFHGGIGSLENPVGQPMTTLNGGSCEGILCGGNLSLLVSSLGTPWEIDTKGKILFLEDIGEKSYRVDGLLTHLRNAGKFEDCVGVLLGGWTDCPPEYPDKTLTMTEIFEELIVPSGKPILSDVACGHILPTMTLPLGRRLLMDADAQLLEVTP